jgi:hypothetical protein
MLRGKGGGGVLHMNNLYIVCLGPHVGAGNAGDKSL